MNMESNRRLPRTLRAAWLAGAAALALAASHVCAQARPWPEQTVRIIAAGPAGGSADIIARLLADGLGRQTGKPVVVEPKPSAGGVLAVNELSRAPHDGYTLLVGVDSLVSEVPHILKLRADMFREIKPLVELGRSGLVLVGAPSLPARTLADVIAWAKDRPGNVQYASYSPGTASHLLGLRLNQAAGIDMVHIGYKGSTPALADVMGGHVPLMFDGMATSIPLVKSGRIKAFAVSTPGRSPLLPEVPTFAELGYPQLETTGWMGLWVKPDVPVAVQAQVRDAALAALAQPAVRQRLLELGFEPGQPRSSEEMSAALRAAYERNGALLHAIGFRPE